MAKEHVSWQRRAITALRVFACAAIFAQVSIAAEVDKKVNKPGENGMGNWLTRLGRVHLPDENERSHVLVKNVFRDIVAPSSHSTVRVISDGTQSSLGVIVHENGYVLTKASDLRGKVECFLFDGRRLPATKLAADRQDLDLALLKIAATKLPVIQWSGDSSPPVGSWLATPNVDGEPTAIGVVSAPPRAVEPPLTVLGVRLDRGEKGVYVTKVLPGTGAARAGLQKLDVIASFNGRTIDTPDSLTDMIQRLQPGDRVTLAVRRESETLSVVATLGDLNRSGDQEQALLMDSLGGPLSRRRTGFSSVIQHDSVVRPRDCGGVVVDLEGKAIGINIARASRVATYALPSSVVMPAVRLMVDSELAKASASKPPTTPVVSSRP